jgi:hypothetical protein
MIKHTHIICPLFLFFLLWCLCAPGNATAKTAGGGSSTQAGGKAVWAWAEQSGSENAIFISRQVGETWEKPQKISVKEGVNVVPTVANTSGANLMVVWTNFTGSQAQLRYRQLQDGLWSEEKEYYTGLTSNTSPSVTVDRTGKIWLVWAGFDGISDEIYSSTWNGTSFATATAITANDIPDIQPVLGIDEGTGSPWVQWLQFSQKGYVKYDSTWNGSAWSKPTLAPTAPSTAGAAATGTAQAVVMKKASTVTKDTSSDNQASKTAAAANQLEIEIPEFVTVPESASIHIPGYTVHSLPVRSVVDRK